jgi:hypothetical protein
LHERRTFFLTLCVKSFGFYKPKVLSPTFVLVPFLPFVCLIYKAFLLLLG